MAVGRGDEPVVSIIYDGETSAIAEDMGMGIVENSVRYFGIGYQ